MARDHSIKGERYWHCVRCYDVVRWSATRLKAGRRVCERCWDEGEWIAPPHKTFPGFRRQDSEYGICVWMEEFGANPKYVTEEHGVLLTLPNYQGTDLSTHHRQLTMISGEYGTLTWMPDHRVHPTRAE